MTVGVALSVHKLILGTSTQLGRHAYLFQLLILIGSLFLSGTWLGAASRVDTKKECLKDIALHAQNMIAHLGSRFNRIRGKYMTI